MTPLESSDAHSLWTRFFTLSDEMAKFLRQEDIDDFLEMQRQRQQFYERLQALGPDDDYRGTAAWQYEVARLAPVEDDMRSRARAWLNKSRHQNSRVRSYDPGERPLRSGGYVSVKS